MLVSCNCYNCQKNSSNRKRIIFKDTGYSYSFLLGWHYIGKCKCSYCFSGCICDAKVQEIEFNTHIDPKNLSKEQQIFFIYNLNQFKKLY